MEKYIKSITALNDLALQLKSSNQNELDRFAESDIFWSVNKSKPSSRNVSKGTIYQFEFGKNYIPEMSYEHRGLVIGVSGKLLYVLPICSYNAKHADHRNAYHPVHNPTSKSHFFLLKSSEFAFLKHDSVLKLNDIRSVSFSRIKYRQPNGFMDPKSSVYQCIEKIVFSKYFFNYSFQYDKLTIENQRLTSQLQQLQSEKQAAEEKLQALRKLVAHVETDAEIFSNLKQILEIE